MLCSCVVLWPAASQGPCVERRAAPAFFASRRSPERAARAAALARGMSFSCFIPGQPLVAASAFSQVSENRWSVTLTSEAPINELAAFISEPLAVPGAALACHIASAPFESWHFIGTLHNGSPSIIFKTRYVWSERDATPTTVQFGVEMTSAGAQQVERTARHSPPAPR